MCTKGSLSISRSEMSTNDVLVIAGRQRLRFGDDPCRIPGSQSRYRGPLLLDQISCQIRDGQRIGLLGRNGSGKTSLMRMLVREIEPDSGEVLVDSRIRVALLPQDVPRDIRGPSRDVVAAGCPASEDPEAAWRVEQQVKETLSRMELDGDALFETLSSGMKRRVLLASSSRPSGSLAPGRADQSPRYRGHRLARAFSPSVGRYADVRHARSHAAAQVGWPHPGD